MFPLVEIAAVVQALPIGFGSDLTAKTTLLILPNPRHAAHEAIVAYRGCGVLEADVYYGSILRKAAHLADENGVRLSGKFLGISLSDVEHEVSKLTPLFTSERILAAISRGICEAVDFATPIEDPNFFTGIDVQPGHVVAGQTVERKALKNQIINALAERRNVLLRGPSGSGKSALQWDAAYSLRHEVRWFRVRRLGVEDIGDLVLLANSSGAAMGSPVGFLLDNLSAGLIDGWNSLAREVAANSGLVLLASVREEDIYPLTERHNSIEVPVRADNEFAEHFWCELLNKNLTSWTNWQEPWSQCNELLLEYAHILTQGSRLTETLRQQIALRASDPARHVELEILRICAAITSLGARVDVAKLPLALNRSEIEIGCTLPRIVNEHLLRNLGDGSMGGSHELRSLHLFKETNIVSTETEQQAFLRSLDVVVEADIGVFLSKSLKLYPSLEEEFMDALSKRLNENPSLPLITAALTGLGEQQIEKCVDIWFKSPEVTSAPRSFLSAAVLFGISEMDVPEFFAESPIAPAAKLLTEIKVHSAQNNLRGMLLQRMSLNSLQKLIEGAPDLASLTALLVAHVGHSLAPELRDALKHMTPDLLFNNLAQVGELLGTAYLLEPEIACCWVERVGAKELLARIGTEVPWATAATISQEEDGVAVVSDIRMVSTRYQPSPHDEVVKLCELILALCPTANLAISKAIAGPGVIAGFEGFNVADKRIPRGNLPPSSLPAWNRRWSEAIRHRLAPPSYGAFLVESIGLIEKMNLALTGLLDGELRGIRSTISLESLGDIHDQSRELPSPRIPWFLEGGSKDQKESQLQSIIFDGSSDLLRRFAALPRDADSYIMWLGNVQNQIRRTIVHEPWHLLPRGTNGIKPLEAYLELVEDFLVLAGESKKRQKSPLVVYLRFRASIGRALSDARASAKKMKRMLRNSTEKDLRQAFARKYQRLNIHVKHLAGETFIWPMLEVLVIVELDGIHDWLAKVNEDWAGWRNLVERPISMTVMPVVKRMHVPQCALRITDRLFPAPDQGRQWIDHLSLLPMPETATTMWSTFCEAAMDYAVFAAQGLGLDDRPLLEQTAKADALDRMMKSKAQVNDTLPPILQEMTDTLVLLALNQPEELLESQLGFFNQNITPVGEVLLNAQYACYSVDIGKVPEACERLVI